jgi:hypothetical protein
MRGSPRFLLPAVAILALLIAVAGGTWFLRRGRDVPGGTSATSPAAAQSNRPDSAAAKAREPVDLVLQIENGDSVSVQVGTPAVLTVTVSAVAGSSPISLGAPGRPWPGDLRFELADRGADLPWTLRRIDPPRTWTIKGATAPAPAQAEIAVLDAATVHQIEFAIPPDEALRLTPGTYLLRATLPITGIGNVTSNAVTLTATAADATAPAVPQARLEAMAGYYLKVRDWENAYRHALQLVERETADVRAYTLLGDACTGLGRDEEALAAYREAVAAVPQDSPEAPDYLLARIREVEDRLSAKGGGGGS